MGTLNIKDFQLMNIIGIGAGSRVFKTKYNGKIYALKAQLKERALLDTEGVLEKNIWKEINHPFLMNLLACFSSPHHLCYLMEYISRGDIPKLLDFHNGRIPEKHVQFYAAELSLAVNYLHNTGIAHRDIKPKNILVASDGHIKLTDFDISVDLRHQGKTDKYCGTIGYMAPEIAQRNMYGYEVDWWSLGATLYFMLHGHSPVKQNIKKKEVHAGKELTQFEVKYSSIISEFAIMVLKGFMKDNPEDRLGKAGLQEIKPHPFFIDIDWEKLEEKEIKPPFIPRYNIHEELVSENFSLSEDYISQQNESVLGIVRCNKHLKDFYYINPDWKK